VLKARMNADLHMAEDLKNTGKGNLFVIFGEPDIDILMPPTANGLRVKVNGVDVFHPNTGEVHQRRRRRHRLLVHRHRLQRRKLLRPPRLLPRRQRPLQALKTTLKAEIDEEAWATLNSDTSRPFDKPKSAASP
jgi:adenine-specific DNA-methyltransferase